MTPGSVITFYSYKGGVGRTFVLANVAALFARWGLRVLCVDWDLEAPGLHLYFEPYVQAGGATAGGGLTELIASHRRGKRLDWRAHVRKVQLKDTVHPVDFIASGVGGDDYERRMQDLDWEQLFAKRELGVAIETMRDEWRDTYDLILVDSRTGITDIGGICTILLPDMLVLLGTSNRQSLQGLLRVAELADRARSNLPVDRGLLRVLPVLTRFEARVEVERSREWLRRFHDAFDPWVRRWISEGASIPDLLNHIRVPHVPFWTFGEELAVVEEGTSDPESVGFAIETLAALLQHGLDDADRLLASRESYVAESAEASNPFPVDVLVLHSSGEVDIAVRLVQEMVQHGDRVQIHGLHQPLAADRLREARNVVFVSGETLTPKEQDNIAIYLRRFYAERPPVGKIVPILRGTRLPDALGSFSPLIGRLEQVAQLAGELRELLNPKPGARIRRESNPELWKPVDVWIRQSSDGLGLVEGPYTLSATEVGMHFRAPSVKIRDAVVIPWRLILDATWRWEWDDRGSSRDLFLSLKVRDQVGVIDTHEIWLASRHYEIQRLRRQVETLKRWPREDPGPSPEPNRW